MKKPQNQKKKHKKKKRSKPPPKKTYRSAEKFLKNGVDSHFTRVKSSDEKSHIYIIRKDGKKEGTLCRIDKVINWSVGKCTGVAPENGLYKVRKYGDKKHGYKIILAKFRPR